MGSRTEDAQSGFGDATRATRVHLGGATSPLGRAEGSWQRAGPHGQILHPSGAGRPWERSHAGDGGSRTLLASGDPRGTPRARTGGHRGAPGWVLPPAGACECRGSWAGGSSFKGHCQRAALTTAASDRPPLTQSEGERLGHLRLLPARSWRHPGTARSWGPRSVPSPCPHPTGAAVSWEIKCPCAARGDISGDTPRCPR